MSPESPTAALVQGLRASGLGDFVAALLENAGPLGLLGGHALHFSAPMLSLFASADQIEAFADALEDPAAAQALARALSEEGPA